MNEPTITMTGNLATQPELRFTPSGKAVAHVSVVCNPADKTPPPIHGSTGPRCSGPARSGDQWPNTSRTPSPRVTG
jgi:hypothetical protein